MSTLVDKNIKVVTHGMTSATGAFRTRHALAHGKQMVGKGTSGCEKVVDA